MLLLSASNSLFLLSDALTPAGTAVATHEDGCAVAVYRLPRRRRAVQLLTVAEAMLALTGLAAKREVRARGHLSLELLLLLLLLLDRPSATGRHRVRCVHATGVLADVDGVVRAAHPVQAVPVHKRAICRGCAAAAVTTLRGKRRGGRRDASIVVH